MKFIDKYLARKGFVHKNEMNERIKKLKRSYAAAASNRLLADWTTMNTSADPHIRYSLRSLRARARDLVQNDPYANNFMRMIQMNIVGPDGFILRNKSGEWKDGKFVLDKNANILIQNAFWDWSQPQNCTINGNMSFRVAQNIIITTIARDGEIFIHKIKNKNINKYGFAIQLIEPDHVDETYSAQLENGNSIIMGVEIDKYRRPLAYYIKRSNPYRELYSATTMFAGDHERIEAESVYHLFVKERVNQTRGVPWIAPSAIRMKMLSGFEEASLVNARAAACKTGVLTPKENANPEFTGDDVDANNNIIQSIEPGETFVTPFGYDFSSYDPKYPSEQHEAFAKIILRGIASGFGVSYNAMANDYESVNYSSARSSLLYERDQWKMLQSWLTESFLNDLFRDWLDMSIITGAVNLPYSKFDKFNQPYFLPRRWDWVDPEKDANANILAYKNGFKTLEQILAERGMDLEETLEQLRYEKELIKKYGLTLGDEPKEKSNPKSDESEEKSDSEIENEYSLSEILEPINGNGRQ